MQCNGVADRAARQLRSNLCLTGMDFISRKVATGHRPDVAVSEVWVPESMMSVGMLLFLNPI